MGAEPSMSALRPTPSPLASAVTLTVCLGVLAIAFRQDISAGLETALNVRTYNYCLVIPAISLALIHGRRGDLARMIPSPSLWGLAAGMAAAAAWWAGEWAAIAELRQMAVVAMAHAVLLALLGTGVYRALSFPLLYLFLTVPIGSALVGPLQSVTTLSAAALLRLSRVPVAVEGNVIEVPLRAYEVEPSCAGLNFLLVTLVLALPYAWVCYRGTGKRVACVAAALVVAIAANAIRVYGIIALAEFTHRRIDLGPQDHVLYGWVVFSTIILAAMAFGLLFEERRPGAPAPKPGAATPGVAMAGGATLPAWIRAVGIGVLALAPAVAAQAAASAMAGDVPAAGAGTLVLPQVVGEWRQISSAAAPALPGSHADEIQVRSYRNGDGRHVTLVVAYSWGRRSGHKLPDVASLAARDAWKLASHRLRPASLAGQPLQVAAMGLSGDGPRRLAWGWYWAAGQWTGNAQLAHLRQLAAPLHGETRAAAVTLTTDDDGTENEAAAALAEFLTGASALDAALSAAAQNSVLPAEAGIRARGNQRKAGRPA
jgi:EpsI family protein